MGGGYPPPPLLRRCTAVPLHHCRCVTHPKPSQSPEQILTNQRLMQFPRTLVPRSPAGVRSAIQNVGPQKGVASDMAPGAPARRLREAGGAGLLPRGRRPGAPGSILRLRNVPCLAAAVLAAGPHQKGRHLRSGWAGGWRRLPKRLGAVTVGYKMPLRLALGVRETVAGHRLGALEGRPALPMHLCPAVPRGGRSGTRTWPPNCSTNQDSVTPGAPHHVVQAASPFPGAFRVFTPPPKKQGHSPGSSEATRHAAGVRHGTRVSLGTSPSTVPLTMHPLLPRPQRSRDQPRPVLDSVGPGRFWGAVLHTAGHSAGTAPGGNFACP